MYLAHGNHSGEISIVHVKTRLLVPAFCEICKGMPASDTGYSGGETSLHVATAIPFWTPDFYEMSEAPDFK